MTEGFKFPFSFSAKEKGRKRKLPADVRKRKNSLRESGEKNSPSAPVIGRLQLQLIRAKKPIRTAQTAFPLGRLSSSFFCIAFSHRPDFKSFSAACTLTPLTRDECPSVSPLYHFVTQRRSVDTSNSPAAFSVNVKAVHLNSSSVFCGAKYRGGVRRTEGLKCSHIQVPNLFSQPFSSGHTSRGFSPISFHDTEEKCE